MQDRPVVTVSDPGRPSSGDLLDTDEGGPGSRRLLLLGVALVVLLAAVSGGVELQQRRAADAEERRLQAVLALELSPRFTGESAVREAGDTGVLSRDVGVRNTGPRPVTVVAAALGGLRLEQEVVIPPGRDERLRLVQRFDCSTAPRLLGLAPQVSLEVRTGSGTQSRILPLPDGDPGPAAEAGRRACGYLEAFEAFRFVLMAGSLPQDRELRLDVEVGNAGRTPLELVDLHGGDGLQVELVTVDGRPVPLPLQLPPAASADDVPRRVLRLVMRVTVCGALLLERNDVFDGGSATALVTTVQPPGEPSGATTAEHPLTDPEAVRLLAAASC